MAKKNNENKVVYAALTLVLTVLSILVIVTGVATRRSDRDDMNETAQQTEKENAAEDNAKSPGIKDVMADPVTDDTEKEDGKDPKVKPERAPTEPPIISDTEMSEIVTEGVENVNAEPALPEFISPVRGELSKEHSETVLVYSNTMGDYRTHSGIDILTADSAVVVAAADGIVREAWEDPMWGYCISIEHEGDAVSYYKNLSRESINTVNVGGEVSRGDVIGNIGDSALYEVADESHLHFELKIGGVSVDPTDYFEITEEVIYED